MSSSAKHIAIIGAGPAGLEILPVKERRKGKF
jgi:NADPH-dependent glutamate synthase beta subunit-like oxidoreductase